MTSMLRQIFGEARGGVIKLRELAQYLLCLLNVILRQAARIRSRIRQDFMLLVECLGDTQRILGTETKTAAGLTL